MVFKASVIAGRFVAVYLLNQFFASDAVKADASLLAYWFCLFAAVDIVACILLLFARRARFLIGTLYCSAVWSALLALEQLGLSDTLQQLDIYAQVIISTALLLGLLMGNNGWRSKPQSPSLRF